MFRHARRNAARGLRWGLLSVLTLALAGCDSRANPMNWFGNNDAVIVRSEEAGPEPEANPLIPNSRSTILRSITSDGNQAYSGTLVAQVSDVQIERAPGISVVRVTGVARSLGAFDVRLIPVTPPDNTTLRLELRARQPSDTVGQGTETARRVTTAFSLTDQTLAFVRNIEVVSQQNTRSIRP